MQSIAHTKFIIDWELLWKLFGYSNHYYSNWTHIFVYVFGSICIRSAIRIFQVKIVYSFNFFWGCFHPSVYRSIKYSEWIVFGLFILTQDIVIKSSPTFHVVLNILRKRQQMKYNKKFRSRTKFPVSEILLRIVVGQSVLFKLCNTIRALRMLQSCRVLSNNKFFSVKISEKMCVFTCCMVMVS